MPSDKEIREQQEKHPGLRVWGAMPGGLSETSEPGDFPVVPFDDFIAAVAAARAPKWEDCDATGEDFTDAWGRVWVRKDWHVAAVAAAEQQAGEQAHGHYMDGYNKAWSLSAAEIERQVREEEQVAQTLARAELYSMEEMDERCTQAADEAFAAGVKAAREQIVAYLRDETQHPSIEAGAWAYGFAEVIEQGAFNGADALEKP